MHAPAVETPLPPSPGAKPFYLTELDFGVLSQCIHCGLCLPTCPTYDATKLEKHSPRGRIQLMRNVAEGRLDLTEAFGDEMYFSLGCLACETACPAGVDYTRMFEEARGHRARVNSEHGKAELDPQRDAARRLHAPVAAAAHRARAAHESSERQGGSHAQARPANAVARRACKPRRPPRNPSASPARGVRHPESREDFRLSRDPGSARRCGVLGAAPAKHGFGSLHAFPTPAMRATILSTLPSLRIGGGVVVPAFAGDEARFR